MSLQLLASVCLLITLFCSGTFRLETSSPSPCASIAPTARSNFFACCLDMRDCDCTLKLVGAAGESSDGEAGLGGIVKARPASKVLGKASGMKGLA